MVGSNRILPGRKIVNPLGDADLPADEERKLRRALLEKAVEGLQIEILEQTILD
jgi:glycine reductase